MTMLTERRAVAIKIEAIEGTPEVLTAAEVIYAENIKFTPQVESLVRGHNLATLSKLQTAAGRAQMSISFDVPMYGSAAAGTAPFWGVPIQCCGFAETIVAVTSAKYLPASSAIKSCTIKVFVDGMSFRMKGCRGSVSQAYDAGKVPYFKFTFQGIWNPAVDTDAYKDEAILVGNAFPAFVPNPFTAALLTIGGTYKGVSEGWKWDIGNKINLQPDASVTDFKCVIITDRDPKGEIDAEAVIKATYDFFGKLAAKTSVAIQSYVGADYSGTGTGAASAFTDTTANWNTNQWASAKLLDSAGAVFPITANTATVLTVTGTPATGDYVIYQAGKLIRTKVPAAVFSGIGDQDKSGIYHNSLPFEMALVTGDDEIEIFCI